MTYNAGTYTYTAPNYVATGKYSYSFYASKNGGAINWGNKTTNGTQTIELSSNVNDTTAYEWDREPGSAVTYTLNVEYYETVSGAWGTWEDRGLYYSTTSNDISSGLWGVSLAWASSIEGVNKYAAANFEIESA